MKIDFEDWQVKQLREHFGYNDSSQTSHWAYPIFHKAHTDIKEGINGDQVALFVLRKKLRDFIVWQKQHNLLKDPLTIDYELADTYLETFNL